MAAYSYKRVAYRKDYLEMEKTFAERYGEEADGDPSYLGDNWVIAADLLEAKDAEIEALRAKVAGLEGDLERERMRLAACSTAALGYFEEPCHDDYRSAALDDILQIRAHLADAVAFARKAGHLPGCGADRCATCGMSEFPRGVPLPKDLKGHSYTHDFQPGKCTCDHDRIVGSEGEGDG